MISIGTDCSGIEAPVQALLQMGITFKHKWSSEIDPFARKSLLANYEPDKLYTDITTRDHAELPFVDIYVCGFPCQPFSTLGKKLGTNDSRGNIMLHCIETIRHSKPNLFILENVKRFKTIENAQPFNYLINQLVLLGYNVSHFVLNTKDYGLPQNRERIFIIGTKQDSGLDNIQEPPPTVPMKPLEDLITDKTVYNIELSHYMKNILQTKTNLQLPNNELYIVCRNKFVTFKKDISPTLVTHPPHYITKYQRYFTPQEALSLQGFSKTFKQVVSNTQMYKQVGNSMSVPVLVAIFKAILMQKNSQE